MTVITSENDVSNSAKLGLKELLHPSLKLLGRIYCGLWVIRKKLSSFSDFRLEAGSALKILSMKMAGSRCYD
jgi:hypothetical protein